MRAIFQIYVTMNDIDLGGISLECESPYARSVPVISALGLRNKFLFLGSSSVSGDLWTGDLTVYKLKNSPTNYLGQLVHEDELALVDNVTQQIVTRTSFEASVASIAPLNPKCSESTDGVIVGLNDGSIQLVTLRGMSVNQNSYQFQMQPVTINSATYHDWPLEKVITSQISGSSNMHIVTLDVSGCVKLWDYQSLMPIKSWCINSTSWPVNGSAFSPDISMLSSKTTTFNEVNAENFLLSTLTPLDCRRKICLWDIRINSVLNPTVLQSSNCSSLPYDDLPTTLHWFTTNQLLIGTYMGNLLVYDIRNPKCELNSVKISHSNETVQLKESVKPPSIRCKQIVQILVHYPSSNTDNSVYVGVLQIDGTIDVYKYDISLNDMFTHVYHSDGYYEEKLIVNNYGRVKPCGLFLSSSITTTQSWKMLISSGIPDIPLTKSLSAYLSSTKMNNNNTQNTFTYELRVHPNIPIKAPGFQYNTSRIHYVKCMNA
ncbi:unnamed protein product [Heterobilharzia americana]|nr:unnamed protein product [Heterobilharzia americana]